MSSVRRERRDNFLDQIDVEEIIEFYGIEEILSHIPVDSIMEYMGGTNDDDDEK